MARLLQAGRAIIGGTLVEAERLAGEALDIGRGGGQAEATWAYAMHLFLIRVEQGRVDEDVAAELGRVADEIRGAGSRFPLAEASGALASLDIGRTHGAKETLTRIADASARPDYYSMLVDSMLAKLATRLKESAYCDLLYERLRPFSHWVVPHSAFPAPSVSFHLGLLARVLERYDTADTHFAEAVADHERIGAPAFLARTRLEWAKMLLSRGGTGDDERAHVLVDDAATVAHKLGLTGVEREAAALLGR